jgi:hypothetical protein
MPASNIMYEMIVALCAFVQYDMWPSLELRHAAPKDEDEVGELLN